MELRQILFDKMGLDGKSLQDRTALVTGGAMGIGRQTALGLAALGAKVAIVDLDMEKAGEVTEEIQRLGGQAWHLKADIAVDGQLLTAVSEVCQQWHQIDILINNAAKAFIGSFEEETQEVWDQIFNTNMRCPAAAIRFVLPRMLKNEYGVVVNVISLEGLAFSAAYSASKVSMRSLTTSISTEIGHEAGVSLFSFAPGIVDTPLVNNYFYPQLAARFGLTMQGMIDGIGGNPGYQALMPVEHCGAALASCIVKAHKYNGQVVSPFLPLAKAGVIRLDQDQQPEGPDSADENTDRLRAVNTSLKEYLKSATEINRNLEHRIEVRTQELIRANEELKAALAEVKQLSGLLPICANCKGIRDDQGYWTQLEDYISTHTEAIFSHSICPECAKKMYPDLDIH